VIRVAALMADNHRDAVGADARYDRHFGVSVTPSLSCAAGHNDHVSADLVGTSRPDEHRMSSSLGVDATAVLPPALGIVAQRQEGKCVRRR